MIRGKKETHGLSNINWCEYRKYDGEDLPGSNFQHYTNGCGELSTDTMNHELVKVSKPLMLLCLYSKVGHSVLAHEVKVISYSV